MNFSALLESLGYAASANCLRGDKLAHAPDYGHVFRRATETAGLEAVYCLQPPSERGKPAHSLVPVTYVCKASTLEQADQIHRLVWNQNVVPFLIVLAPQNIRVYSGFAHGSARGKTEAPLVSSPLADAVDRLKAFSAASIDNGDVWEVHGSSIRTESRVEWRLLEDLKKLEETIVNSEMPDSELVHSLIGKFVYHYYLRHRGILSDKRLEHWNLTWDDVAGETVKLTAFIELCDHLDERLNGSIFPLSKSALKKIGAAALQRIASVFSGHSADGQHHFAFDAYDFSHIPIETLSVIYEQFLHQKKKEDGSSEGEDKAAYYTPIPVVNFILDRMDELHPLRQGMRVLDPSCGSGAFLVQCYRKLIEDRWRSAPNRQKPSPTELRDLLVKHVFGIDADREACQVARLSLLLTLLDYVDPPDLLTTNGREERFKLPDLDTENIVEANAFDDGHPFVAKCKKHGFDWIVGNPPWKDLKGKTTNKLHKPVLDWMLEHKASKPTGGNQAAEAFMWRAEEFASKGAIAGLLVPAMTLFKNESRLFRQKFFLANPLAYVANFANLAEVLFAGRSRVPAAAMLFRPHGKSEDDDQTIPVFSPLVANQESTRPRTAGKRIDTWSLVIDENEIRHISLAETRSGEALPWKLAAWGSNLDRRLLRRVAKLRTLGDWAEEIGLTISEGLQIRGPQTEGGEAVEPHPELACKKILVTSELSGTDKIFSFPDHAVRKIEAHEAYVRKGRFSLPESVCRPPHVIVSASCNWAVFSNQYLIVPPRQIGISGEPKHGPALKALAAYLNSEFLEYHQFFESSEQGVKRPRTTLKAVRQLPIPNELANQEPAFISNLNTYWDLFQSDPSHFHGPPKGRNRRKTFEQFQLFINGALGFNKNETERITDFVNILNGLQDGKTQECAVAIPGKDELQNYGIALKQELDAFIDSDNSLAHNIQISHDDTHGVVEIELQSSNGRVVIHPRNVGGNVLDLAAELKTQLESHFSQWRYFNRNLRLFAKDRVYLFKPMQRFHWLRSQAVLDATEVIGMVLDQPRENQ